MKFWLFINITSETQRELSSIQIESGDSVICLGSFQQGSNKQVDFLACHLMGKHGLPTGAVPATVIHT